MFADKEWACRPPRPSISQDFMWHSEDETTLRKLELCLQRYRGGPLGIVGKKVLNARGDEGLKYRIVGTSSPYWVIAASDDQEAALEATAEILGRFTSAAHVTSYCQLSALFGDLQTGTASSSDARQVLQQCDDVELLWTFYCATRELQEDPVAREMAPVVRERLLVLLHSYLHAYGRTVEDVTSLRAQLVGTEHVSGTERPMGEIALDLIDKRLQELQGNAENEDHEACVICLSEPRRALLEPCLHLALCVGCKDLVNECPVCRQPIERRVVVYSP